LSDLQTGFASVKEPDVSKRNNIKEASLLSSGLKFFNKGSE